MFKKTLLAALVGWTTWAAGAVQTFDNTASPWTPNSLVPDANAAGVGFVENLSAFQPGDRVTQVTVTLNLVGGWNGDLYAYLAHDGQMAVLLNRVGKDTGKAFGYGDSGMCVTFTDAAANGNIHTYRSVPGYSITGGAQWQPDGRAVDPAYVKTSDTATRLLSSFSQNGGVLANGDWTLFIADLSGGGQSRLAGWSLQVQAIPEPVATALGIFGSLFLLSGLARRRRAAGPPAARGAAPAPPLP